MSDLIKIKGGHGNVPPLQEREPAYSYENGLYIGTPNGNVRVGGDTTALEAKITALEGQISGVIARLEALENE